MAILKFKRSAVPGRVPGLASLELGELAINTFDGKVYMRKDDGTASIVEVGGGAGVLSFNSRTGAVTLTSGDVTTALGGVLPNGLGAVDAPSYTFAGDLNTGMWSPAADTIAFSEGGVEAMRITNSANVGIGTTAPQRILHLATAEPTVVLQTTSAAVDENRWRVRVSTAGDFAIGTMNDAFSAGQNAYVIDRSTGITVENHIWSTAGSERVRITNVGSFLVATTTASSTSTADGFVVSGTTSALMSRRASGANQNHINFVNNGVSVGRIDTSTTATSYSTSSTSGITGVDANTVAIRTNSAERMRIDSAGAVTANVDFRAPIFYDSGNTAFYLDPANTGTSLITAGGVQFYSQDGFRFTSASAISAMRFGSSFTGESTAEIAYNRATGTTTISQGNTGSALTRTVGITTTGVTLAGTTHYINTDKLLLQHNGTDGYIRSVNAGGDLYLGGGNQNTLRLHASNYAVVSGSTRSPIFYDSDNTSYFVDPASGSTLAGTLNQFGYLNIRYGGSAYAGMGISNQFASASNFATSFIDFSNESNTQKASIFGNFGTDGSGYLQFLSTAPGTARATDSRTTTAFAYFNQWTFQTAAGITSNIYYDRDNTAYYVDPNSTGTSLRTAGDWRSDSSAWTGEFNGKIQYHSNNWYFQAAGAWEFRRSDTANAFSVTQGGTATALADMRAPIFYDSNNTARYLDPTGDSYIQGSFYVVRNGNSNDAFGGLEMRENSFQGIGTGAATEAPGINFHWSARAAARLYMDAGGNFVLGGQGDITNNRRSLSLNELFAVNQVRGSIFYDSANTAFYTDPASTSVMNALQPTNIGVGQAVNTTWRIITSGVNGIYLNGSGYGQAEGSWRAPIFYNSNDTTVRWAQNELVLRGGSPTIFFRDTDHNSAMIHCNSNLLYVLRGGNDTEAWAAVNGQWPLVINLTNNDMTVGGNFTAVGNVTAFSDINVKDNVEQIGGALERVSRIRGVTYTRTDLEDKERRYGGVIAQEIERVLPEAIFEQAGMKAVDYNATIGLLIEAIKELTNEIETLKADIRSK
jgi:hypothetical protein